VKLVDFDTVQNWEPKSPKSKDVIGTDGYLAPEAYSGEYSPASDMYCAGVIMYQLLTRKFPHPLHMFDYGAGENWVGSPAMRRIQHRLLKTKIDFSLSPLNHCSPSAVDLLQRLLAYEPDLRPTADFAVKHPWFRAEIDDTRPSRRLSVCSAPW